jgi:hypothetical protein
MQAVTMHGKSLSRPSVGIGMTKLKDLLSNIRQSYISKGKLKELLLIFFYSPLYIKAHP